MNTYTLEEGRQKAAIFRQSKKTKKFNEINLIIPKFMIFRVLNFSMRFLLCYIMFG
ncbi:MAG: hypothetical protein F6K39_17485 [Okeania sp. SIO3B3]|nr:hypothetical protein [Okeania sp. SIO3B3]